MDILIKNMEMPEEGKDKVITIMSDGSVWEGGFVMKKFHGKAIELPEHGDLIERDRAINEMEFVSFDTIYNCELAQEVLRYNVPVFLEASI